MTCDERHNLWILYACDQLDPAEKDDLRRHLLTGCPACIAALAEAEAIAEQLLLSVTPESPPPTAVGRLMESIRSEGNTIHTYRRWSHWLAPAVAALIAIALTSTAWLYYTRDAREFWKSSNLMTVVLSSKTQPAARGQVWWDHDSRQWRVSVSNLTPTASDREYELWLIPANGKPIRSRTFKVNANGKSTLVVPVPSGVGEAAVAAITDEPIGGSDQPTGHIHLAGTFE